MTIETLLSSAGLTLGVPMLQDSITNTVLLVDETDTHYIVGISPEKHVQALESNKELIKAILYHKSS